MSEGGCRRLVNKVAIITAASTGIGYGIAERFAQEGAKVIVSSRNKQHVDEAVSKLRSQGLEAHGIVCHVGKPEDRKNLVEGTLRKYGGIDILVGNAAVSPATGPILSTTEEQFDKMVDINLKSQFMLVKEIVPHMEKRGGGSIILIGSIGGYAHGEHSGIYSTTKTALVGLTRALSPQLSAMNIRVNLLAPGLIKTRMSKFFWGNEELRKQKLANVHLKRIGQVHEIGGVAAFIASDDASYMTGESIVVAGGWQSRL